MKHACALTLKTLEPLISAIRGLPGLRERKPGIFYVKSKAYLHFHEDPAGVFADIKLRDDQFSRYPVNTPREQEQLIKLAQTNLASK